MHYFNCQPLNPVLGELFYGTWPDRDGRGETELIVEQVSHHPPIVSLLVVDPDVRLTRVLACSRSLGRLPSEYQGYVARALLIKNSFIENKKAGVSLQGHSGQKTSFSGTAIHGELFNDSRWLRLR